MKKSGSLAACMLLPFWLAAQVELLYDFNSLSTGNLAGQDAWV